MRLINRNICQIFVLRRVTQLTDFGSPRFRIVNNFYPVVYLLININDRSAREMRVEEDGNEKGLSLLPSYHLGGRGSAGLACICELRH